MDESKPFYQRIEALINYGVSLSPNTVVVNKSKTLLLHVAPGVGFIGHSGNINIQLDGIVVGHYCGSTGDFVYAGGKALKAAYPEKRIKRALSDLLRSHLNSDKEEYGHRPFPDVETYDDFYRSPYTSAFATLCALGIFEVPLAKWYLGFFEVHASASDNKLVVFNTSTKAVLATLTLRELVVSSNKISEQVMKGVLFYLIRALGEWWKLSGRIAKEPPVWDWADTIAGTRRVNLNWVAWDVFVKKDSHTSSVVSATDYSLKAAIATAAQGLEKEHNERRGSYVPAMLDVTTRLFEINQTVKHRVY